MKDLRAEIAATQSRRMGYVKLKLALVVGLLGVGGASVLKDLDTTSLLYLVPLVSFIFDLYVMGEDFGIKRAGCFIGSSPHAPSEERFWETAAGQHRDWFSYFAGPLSSLCALVAAGIALRLSHASLSGFRAWLVVSGALVLAPFANRWLQAWQLKRFARSVAGERKKSFEGRHE